MSKHATIRRYTLLIEKISRNQFPSFLNLKEYLQEHDFDVSARTIQRDIEQIRFEFGIDIIYDRERNGYYIDTSSSINMNSFLRFLEIVNTAELLTESLKESKHSLNYISFESQGDLKGIEYLKPLLFAIKNRRKLSFIHQNFHSGKQRNYTLKPYLLKEYQNRWYLVGVLGEAEDFRTFGIDRIQKLEIKEETYTPKPHFHPNELFEQTVGLTYSIHEVEEVELSFNAFQGKYIKTLPLHSSQQITIDNDEELRLTLHIKPNFEFKQKILMLGENVKVLKPTWFVKELKDSLKATLRNYN